MKRALPPTSGSPSDEARIEVAQQRDAGADERGVDRQAQHGGDRRDDDQGSVAVDQGQPEQQDRRRGRHVKQRDGNRGEQCQEETDNADDAGRGWARQAPEPGFEHAFDAHLEAADFGDQPLKFALLDAPAVDPRRKPGAGAAEHHLGRNDHQRDAKKTLVPGGSGKR